MSNATAVANGDGADVATGEVMPARIRNGNRAVAMLRPIASPAEVIEAQNETRRFVHEALKEGRDYGVIPGTDRKSMLKPGAERTALAFGCVYGDPVLVEQEIDHDRIVKWRKVKHKYEWHGNRKGKKIGEEVTDGESIGLYRYVLKVPVIHMETGNVVAVGVGSCSTMENKYIDRPRDMENTVLKMAHKRGLVAACLLAFGLSDEFTQDVEDMPAEHFTGGAASESTAEAPARAAAPAAPAGDAPPCPKCGGLVWDNRVGKKNPKAPDFKCRDKSCDGVIWPPREKKASAKQAEAAAEPEPVNDVPPWDYEPQDSEIPF